MNIPNPQEDGPEILQILEDWEKAGKPDPSPWYSFHGWRGVTWVAVSDGQVFMRDGFDQKRIADPDTVRLLYLAAAGQMPTKADAAPASRAPAPSSRAQARPIVPGGLGEEIRCRECGALGWGLCPGCRGETYSSRWRN